MTILAIDPGPEKSALVIYNGVKVTLAEHLSNYALLDELRKMSASAVLVVEMVESFGMAVGREVFETVFWSGRFCQAFAGHHDRIGRKDVKLHLCQSARAKDGNIRQAILDRFGGKEAALGRKATPGPLHGVSGHCWSALAVALVYWDRRKSCPIES